MTTLATAMRRDSVSRRVYVPWCSAGSWDGLWLDTQLFGLDARSILNVPAAAEVQEQHPQLRWHGYLNDLVAEGFVHAAVVDTACKWVRERLQDRWPAAAPAGDGVMLVWDLGTRYVEVEVASDGNLEWFCKWRDTGEYLNGEPGRNWVDDGAFAAALTGIGTP